MDNLAEKEMDMLALRIRDLAARHALSHAIILTGQVDLSAAARHLAAAMECQAAHPPCGTCNICHKVLTDIHPDVTWVVDPEHKNISIDVLRTVRSDAYILPNEGQRKVYIFPDCSLLDAKAQNVLLKVVEEGPSHAAFIFCAESSGVLLQTIRSRCVEWKLNGEKETPSCDAADELCALLDRRDPLALTAWLTGLEPGKMKREELIRLLDAVRDLLGQALLLRYGRGEADAPSCVRSSSTASASARASGDVAGR